MSSGGNKTGFTLIEMLVALTIILAILGMVYGSFAATTRSIDASNTRLAGTERACFVLRLMTRQIRCAYAPRAVPSPSSGAAANDQTEGSRRAPIALFRGDCRDPQGEILSLTTSSGLGAGPDAPRGLFRVDYLYDRTSSTLSIRRYPDDDRSSPKRSDFLLSNVASIELKFHDGRQWQPTWDIAQRHELPRAVRLALTVADEAGRPHSLGTTIPIVQETHSGPRSTQRIAAAGQP